MPLVRISVSERMSPEKRRLLPHAVYDAMRATISIPEDDLFVVLTAHGEDELIVHPSFLGGARDGDFTLVQITMRRGRTIEAKQFLYREMTRLIGERASISAGNLMVVLMENDLADWSFSNGEAQYVLNPPAQPSGAAR